MARQGLIGRHLGFALSAERALADAFVLVGLRHAADPEMRNAARLHSNWCRAHIDAIRAQAKRHGMSRASTGKRLRRALFRGGRVGGSGLVRDLQDLLTLATSVHACWIVLRQTALERHDRSLVATCQDCGAETVRQISWLESKLRHSAPQALSVPAPTTTELVASMPSSDQVGAIADLVPGPAIRALVPSIPAVTALGIVAVILALAWPRRLSGSVPYGERARLFEWPRGLR